MRKIKKRLCAAIMAFTLFAVPSADILANTAQVQAADNVASNPAQVQLGEGMFKDSQQIGKDYLLTYDVDRLAVSLFRYSSNRSKAPVNMNNGYGGWEDSGENGLGGHIYGHYMSACVAMYMQTGDERLKENVERGVELLGIAQDDDGFVAGFGRTNLDYVFNNPNNFWSGGNNDAFLQGIWAPWYTIHKILAGLLDAYQYMGIDEALVYAEKLASYAKTGTDKLNDEQMEKMLYGEHGGINESFATLYEITGKEEYIELAKRFSHKLIMDPLSRGEDNLPGLHANTQIPKICGAAKIYQLTGDEYYKRVCENFWKFVVEHQTYANGGTSNYEFFTNNDEEPLSDKNCETCCVYNMLKLTEYIYQWDHSSKYMDYYENVLYNQILGSQNSEGRKTYSVDLSMGASTVYLSHDGFECCLGTGMENPARYSRMIYYTTASDLYVNLFINSTADWTEGGMQLTQTTEYPESDTVKLTVNKASGESKTIKIRVPEWTENMEVAVNGTKADVQPQNGYLSIERKWKAQDIIEVKIPMRLRLYVSRGNDNVVAFKYGAILLAGDLGQDIVRKIVAEDKNPETFIEKTGDGLDFAINGLLEPGKTSITLKPFYEFESEPHMVYWNLYTPEEYELLSPLNGNFEERLYEATVDSVNPGHQQSELDHNYKVEGNSASGIHAPAAISPATGSWRDVRDGYISYDLKVNPKGMNYLLSMFWGSDAHGAEKRIFDIIVEDTVLQADYELNNNLPDQIEYFYLKIPKELTRGKDKVTVKYRAAAGNQAGGIFGVRITDKPVGEIAWDTKINSDPNEVQLNGTWNTYNSNEAYQNTELYTTEKGASLTYTFTGSEYIRLSAKIDGGKDGAELYVDGKKAGKIATGADKNVYEVAWESSALDKDAEHTLELVTTGSFGFDYLQLGNEVVKIGNPEVEDNPEIEAITVTAPTKTTYTVGEELDLSGMKVTALYDDGTEVEIDNADCEVTGYNPETTGVQKLTVSYGDYSATFEVTVKEIEDNPEIEAITVTAPTKTTYTVGEELDLSGMKVTALYDDGTEVEIDNVDCEVTGYNPEMTGVQKVTVSYGDYSATFEVTVKEIEKMPYVDVAEDDWFYDGVYYNYFAKTMTGKDKTHFAPYENLARAQFAVILYRMEGAEAEDAASFPDVPAGMWYSKEIKWASDAKVVTGYSSTGTFGPADNILREQMAVMMYRYAKLKGYDVSKTANYSEFTDGGSVTGYAEEAMKWAVGTGIITGKDLDGDGTKESLDPLGNTSRAEASIIIQRFMEHYTK